MPIYQYGFTTVTTGSTAPGGSNLNNQTVGVFGDWSNPSYWLVPGGNGTIATIPQNPGRTGWSTLLIATAPTGPLIPTNQKITGLFFYQTGNGIGQPTDIDSGFLSNVCAVAINGSYNGYVYTGPIINSVYNVGAIDAGSIPYTGPPFVGGATSLFGWSSITSQNVFNISLAVQWNDRMFQIYADNGPATFNLAAENLLMYVTTAFAVPVMPRRKYMVSLVDQLP